MNLTEDDIITLFYLQRYTFLTIKQTVRVIHNNRSYQNVGRRLRTMAQAGYSDSFGGGKMGFHNVPKVYYLKKPGYEILLEHDFPEELLGRFKQKSKPGWTSKTKHRLHLIDVFIALECGVRDTPTLDLRQVFFDYKRVKQDGREMAETTDFFDTEEVKDIKIVPDGAFILRNLETKDEELFFIEMDMGTEGIVSRVSKDINLDLYSKIQKYDKYLTSFSWQDKYRPYGEFDHFILLFVTLSPKRLDNIRTKLFDLPQEYHEYYMFNTYEVATANFFNKDWKRRSVHDDQGYSILG